MGWRKEKYERGQRKFVRTNPLGFERDRKDFILDNFVFRPHFFDGYRERVQDPSACERTIDEIARIAVHCMCEADLPERIPQNSNFNLLVSFHLHEETGEEIPFSYDILRTFQGAVS